MEIGLEDSVAKVPLIGPQQAKKLKKLGVQTVEDLLHHYPSRYDDFSQIKKISEVIFGETVTVSVTVREIHNIFTRGGKNLIKAKLEDPTGAINVVWFNQAYLLQTLPVGTPVSLSGKVGQFSGKLTFISPEYEIIKPLSVPQGEALQAARPRLEEDLEEKNLLSGRLHTSRLVPVYPETAGLSSKWLRSRINYLLKSSLTIVDHLPAEILTREGLVSLKEALSEIHFPKNQRELNKATKRLAFDELFFLQMKAQLKRREWERHAPRFKLPATAQEEIKNLTARLPFELTADQEQAVNEILNDLSRQLPMNRLLQGDVGCGKTIVAALAAYAASLAGYKSLYMAPTEILANQHYQTFQKLFQKYGIKIGLITSSTGSGHEFKIPNLKFEIIIGTQALLYRLSELDQIGLVIVDEQHKFGVEQRARLLEISKDEQKIAHLLTITATPIPRTLSLVARGDLEISSITTAPKNRKKIKTWLTPKEKRQKAYDWIKEQMRNHGTQTYIICPFIEESESETLKSVRAAKREYERLVKIFSPFKVALLHGKLGSAEKEKTMKEFVSGATSVLVSTPVVEVGIDNANATVIVIEAAERFGLASLHQLRGRVGRGDQQSYCLLFTENQSPPVKKRLQSVEKIHSGLMLAELDLKNRGSGSIFGVNQSGFTKTKMANLSDLEFIQKVRQLTKDLLADPKFEEKNKQLIEKINLENTKIHLD